MPRRTLGRTGESVSLIGLGGYHLGTARAAAETTRIIRSAIDRGVNFLDNCWDYHDGESEHRMGDALRDGYRAKVFLMTKVDGRTRTAAMRQIEDSLRRLRTDCIDLMQFHEVIRMEDPDRIFDTGGAAEAFLEAKRAGKIRYVGFTGHKDPVVHLRMLAACDANGFELDAVQMPLNVLDAHFRSFEKDVLPELTRRGIGVLAMKPLAGGKLLEAGVVSAREALHYVMHLPVSVVITGTDSMATLDQALEAAASFRALAPQDVTALLARTAEMARTGRYEPFKTRTDHDGTAQNVHWLG